MPSPYEAVLLALAAWRVWHLIALDDITDRPRRYITEGRDKLLDFIECPYCGGFWLSLAVYLFWLWLPTETMYACLPFALNVGLIATYKLLNDE